MTICHLVSSRQPPSWATLETEGDRKRRRRSVQGASRDQIGSGRGAPTCPANATSRLRNTTRIDGDWRDDHSLPVLVARGQVEALRTAGDPEGRYRAKRLLVLGLYDLGYHEDEVRETFRLLDWMMHLRVDLERQLQSWLDRYAAANT